MSIIRATPANVIILKHLLLSFFLINKEMETIIRIIVLKS